MSYQSETLSEDFTRLVQQISSQIQQLTKNVAHINRIVSSLGSAQDTDELRQKLHELQHKTHTQCQTTMEFLKELSALKPPLGAASYQTRQWKLQKERLMNDFSVVLNNFQSAQRTAASKEKAGVMRAKYNSGLAGKSSFDGQNRLGEEGAQIQLQVEQHADLEVLHERERALRQLESDILDVNHIFKDLALMVHQQGEVVDSIEANVDSTVLHVEHGTSNVRQAAEYQRKLRRKQVFCVSLLIVVIAIFVLIIYLTTRSGSSTR